jgi:tyrosine-protein kinase Etk/Wzc
VKTEEALRDFQRNNKAVAVEAQSKAMIEAAAMIQGQITGYEVQLQVMSAYLSPDNPDLSRVRSSIEELKKQLALLEFGKGGEGRLAGRPPASGHGDGAGSGPAIRAIVP